jgi:hypothetical protein
MDSLKILGLVNLGTSWSSARRGLTYNYAPPPFALLIRVDGPGHISVYQGEFLIAELLSGKIQSLQFEANLGFLAASIEIFSKGLNAIRQAIHPPEYEPAEEWHSFEWTAYTNTIASVINGIELRGHGGAVIFSGPGGPSGRRRSRLLRSKYQFLGKTLLREHFVEFLNARHALADAHELSDADEVPTPEARLAVAERTLKYRNALRQLNSTTAFISGLAAADGALLMTADLECWGFGTEILLEQAPPPPVNEILDQPGRKRRRLDGEQFGMRHRSAFRLCAAASNLVVFVVSQDGGTSLVWNDKGKVQLKRPLNTVNANMPG